MKGLVTKSTGSWYVVRSEDGKDYEARIRGKFRLDQISHTNPLAVGDHVDFDLDSDDLAVITNIYPRNNYIIRRSVNLSKRTHIIASNIDLAFLIITIANPRTSTGFIDRFLVTCEAYQIPVMMVFNKVDEWREEEIEIHEDMKFTYEDIGYDTMTVSALRGDGLDELKAKLKGKISLVAGHSGVGKSTLVNALSPGLDLKTKVVSGFNNKGKHTTTFAQMYEWPFGGYVIDTPGIKEFGLVEIDKDEMQDYFPEIFALRGDCRFHNCNHLLEPKCAVRKAVEEGEIAGSRYESYLTFLEEINEDDYSKS
ncbi:ribosome small subunit-dependent GTPase A [Weeksellaceae bacterium KMM 9713]|uniref:Small ribosomal subunit biogenesis GTPase RsgA n=1 Tax=Profundicola chukchiensis TaxID=2961959 RepID=A0A9X4MWG1_9FLAO|nr:ribosome small subunit-dependent GTPase A [Profundicola chukchiensis]MDG4945333.1 ribosome small subunit-dependent GTPase A [Profundicola chukchiensis]MDG4950406.1 ribosome small subunit-dependent GTPase A [Profundicola chukchiensis]